MTKNTRGHTAEGEQLELTWEIPPATPATPDFVCWLWAAFPPRQGRLNISRIAKALEISPTTLRRWLSKDDPKLRHQQVAKVRQRAILRGRGTYLWPDVDPVSRRRGELLHATAVRNNELITNEPERVSPTWRKNGTLDPHEVHIVHWEKAHAYGVAMTTHPKALARINRHGTILETITVSNKYAAIALKREVLARVDEHRCITPKHLVPTGHTETWRGSGGPTTLRRPLEVSMIRFAGLPFFEQVTTALQTAHPHMHITSVVAQTATEACEALARPADIVILTSHGYTSKTWGGTIRRPWPGGSWYAGGRGSQAPGMSLRELTQGMRELGGFRTPLLIIDTGEAGTMRPALRKLTAGTETQILLKTHGKHGKRELDELVEILNRAYLDREAGAALSAGLTAWT